MRPLRPYQTATIQAARDAIASGKQAPLIVMPTGAGKTAVGTTITSGGLTRGRRTLWLAHTRELVDQAVESIAAEGVPRSAITTLRAGRKNFDPSKPVCVASTQTMLVCEDLPPADIVVFDEAHHYVATEWRRVSDRYREAVRVGLTATPQRSDCAPLGDLFDCLIQQVKHSELIGSGVLVPCTVIAPTERLRARTVAVDPVDAYLEHAAGTQAMVFNVDVEDAKRCAERFMSRGVAAACVEGGMSASDRRTAIERFRRGQLRVLTNVYVLTEGFDVPAASTCVLARGCGSLSTYIQIAGRVLRCAPGKSEALLIDLCGNWRAHGLPDEDREWTLDGNGVVKRQDSDRIRQCPKCGFVGLAWQGECPKCEFVAPVKPVFVNGAKLTPVQRGERASGAEKQAYYDWLCREQRGKGYKRGWIAHRFYARFAMWPGGYRESSYVDS